MNSMKIGSSLFDHKNIHKITWTSNDHTTKTQIEHIAIGPRWRMACLKDVRVYQAADVCSDHHLSIAKIKIKLKRQKRKASMLKRFDTSKLKDSATEAQFETLLRNRLSALADTPPGTPEWWEKLKEAMAAGGEEILGYKKSLREAWISDNTWRLISARKNLHQMRHNANSDSNAIYQEYIEKDREEKRSAQKDKRAWMESQAKEAEGAAARNDMRAVHQIAKKITGSSKASTRPVKAKDGTLLPKRDDKLAR